MKNNRGFSGVFTALATAAVLACLSGPAPAAQLSRDERVVLTVNQASSVGVRVFIYARMKTEQFFEGYGTGVSKEQLAGLVLEARDAWAAAAEYNLSAASLGNDALNMEGLSQDTKRRIQRYLKLSMTLKADSSQANAYAQLALDILSHGLRPPTDRDWNEMWNHLRAAIDNLRTVIGPLDDPVLNSPLPLYEVNGKADVSDSRVALFIPEQPIRKTMAEYKNRAGEYALAEMDGAYQQLAHISRAGGVPAGPAAKAAGFIAVSDERMTWPQAQAYCRQRGGKLPRMNNSDSWARDPWSHTKLAGDVVAEVEGFGPDGGAWPAGLPGDYFWTGTVVSGDLGPMGTVSSDGVSWCLYNSDGKVVVTYDYQNEGEDARAACVR